MTEIATEDFTRYDPAVDREIRTDDLWTDHLILRLGQWASRRPYPRAGSWLPAQSLGSVPMWRMNRSSPIGPQMNVRWIWARVLGSRASAG